MKLFILSSSTLATAAFLFFLTAPPAFPAQPRPVKSGVSEQELIPLPFPHAGMDVGALRWGDPLKPASATLPPWSAFSKSFIDTLPRAAVEMGDRSKRRQFALGVAASPGPQVLQAAKLATGKVGVDFSRASFRCMEWGELTDASVDLQTLSEAMVRGWYNLPGKALHNNALFQMELDYPLSTVRPWIVVRSLTAKGLKYEINKDAGFKFDLSAGHAVYGSGSLGLSYRVLTDTTLQIDQPMVIGYDVALLELVDPPMPKLSTLDGTNMAVRHKFRWRLRESKKAELINVDTADLLARDARQVAEASYPAPVVQELADQVKKGEPVRMAFLGEAKPRQYRTPEENQWRRLEEGSAFRSDELVRLRVVLDEPAFVYVLGKDSSGKAAVLYPKVEGEDLSIGEEKPIEKGEWIFPSAVIAEEGMKFDNDPSGTESFVVVASKTKPDGLPKALAQFARAARDEAAKPATATRSVDLGLPSILRLPSGYAKAQSANPQPAPVAAPTTGATPPPAQAGDTPKPPMEVLFSGLNSATVLKLNLSRVQVP
jgi:hypothetical protein